MELSTNRVRRRRASGTRRSGTRSIWRAGKDPCVLRGSASCTERPRYDVACKVRSRSPSTWLWFHRVDGYAARRTPLCGQGLYPPTTGLVRSASRNAHRVRPDDQEDPPMSPGLLGACKNTGSATECELIGNGCSTRPAESTASSSRCAPEGNSWSVDDFPKAAHYENAESIQAPS